MFISVVIATRNRRALLARTLAAFARQTWPRDRFDIVVADNGSTDGTRDEVAALAARPGAPSIRYLLVREPGKSFAVNAAIDAASGDLLAFTDDDVEPSPAWLARLAAALDDTGADFAAGRILPAWERPAPSWLSPALYGVLAIADNGTARQPIARGVNEHIMPIGANMAVRTSVVRRLGGLRTDLGKLEGTLRTGEDHEFFLRLIHGGCRGVYEPEALVTHLVPASRLDRRYFREWLRQNGRDVAKLEAAFDSGATRLFGVPRYMWRQALQDAAAAGRALLRRDEASRFAAALRVTWFLGYLRESWFGDGTPAPAMRLAEGR